MLPFTKRTIRPEDASQPQVLRTGDLEVLPTSDDDGDEPPTRSQSAPPRVFAKSEAEGDEEMTMLMPRKGMTFSSRPPPPVTPNPMPKLVSSRPPRAMLQEPPTRQFVLPAAPPPSVSPVAGPPRSANRPQALGPQQHDRAALKLQPGAPVAETPQSDPRIDPPATVITARTRIITARPTVSWAAALVAMGVFVGLVTAVVARGDADTLIDATASFVDPSGGHVAGSSGDGVTVQTKADERHTNLVSTVDTLLADAPPSADSKVVADTSSAVPLPARPAPVAYVAPVIHRAYYHPAPHPAPAHDDRVASNAAPKQPAAASAKAAPAPKAAPAAAHSDDDVESASAADALAKAQLEASLR